MTHSLESSTAEGSTLQDLKIQALPWHLLSLKPTPTPPPPEDLSLGSWAPVRSALLKAPPLRGQCTSLRSHRQIISPCWYESCAGQGLRCSLSDRMKKGDQNQEVRVSPESGLGTGPWV